MERREERGERDERREINRRQKRERRERPTKKGVSKKSLSQFECQLEPHHLQMHSSFSISFLSINSNFLMANQRISPEPSFFFTHKLDSKWKGMLRLSDLSMMLLPMLTHHMILLLLLGREGRLRDWQWC